MYEITSIPGIHESAVNNMHVAEVTGGKLAVCPHAYGIGTTSKFTANAIFDLGIAARNYASKTFGDLRTEPIALGSEADYVEYNKFFWVPWSRLVNNVGAFVTRRMKMATPNNFKLVDSTNYVGTQLPATTAWNQYISLDERLCVLNKLFKDIGTSRYRVLDIGCGVGSQLVGLGAYGYDVYGIEGDPSMYRARNPMMEGRILFGDALQDLYAFKSKSFNVCIVSCLGSIWWTDMHEFMQQVANLSTRGGLVILDVKEFYGHEFRDKATYVKLMSSVGIHVQLRTSSMLLGVVKQ
jgi:predicted O-methyltransferase YrrM